MNYPFKSERMQVIADLHRAGYRVPTGLWPVPKPASKPAGVIIFPVDPTLKKYIEDNNLPF